MIHYLFDIVIALMAVCVACLCLFSRDSINSIIYFIALGLIVALIWARLGAFDVAIAEAAIGSGVTGALLLLSWRKLQANQSGITLTENVISKLTLFIIASVVVTISITLSFVLLQFEPSSELAYLVDKSLDESGVINPVTAVLLNFRSFDTLLEIGVLFLAALCVYSIGISLLGAEKNPESNFAFLSLSKIVIPMCILYGGYTLWVGAYSPGGAFQAGAVWAGALILLKLAQPEFIARDLNPWLLVVGLMLFVSVAIITFFMNESFLMYPTLHAGKWILIVETAAAISIALLLYSLFVIPRSNVSIKDKKSVKECEDSVS